MRVSAPESRMSCTGRTASAERTESASRAIARAVLFTPAGRRAIPASLRRGFKIPVSRSYSHAGSEER